MNALEEQLAGVRQTEPERGDSYRRPGEDPLWDLVEEIIRLPELPVTQTAAGARVSTAMVERAQAGSLTGTTGRAVEARKKLTRYAVKHARTQLRSAGVIGNPRKTSAPTVLARYLEHAERQAAERPCARAGCRNPARRRSAYCTDRCARAASAGPRQTGSERGNSYRRPGEDPLWDLVVEVIRLPDLPVMQIAAGARVSTATVERARAGSLTGSTGRGVEARLGLTRYAVKHARTQLRSAGVIDRRRKISPRAVLAGYLEYAERQATGRPRARAEHALHERQHRQYGSRASADRLRRDSKRSGIRRERHIGDLVGGQHAQAGQPGVFAPARRRAIALGIAAVVGLGFFAVLQAAHVFGQDGPTSVHRSSSVVPRALTHHAGGSLQIAGSSGGAPKQAISRNAYSSYLRSLGSARRAATRLQGIRAANLEAVIANVTSIAARGLLIPSRLPVLSLTLDRNREWWSSGPLLTPQQQVEFPGSRLVWQYYPGQGIELSPQASFATAHLLCTAGATHLRACTELLSELLALAVDRSGRLAWEYYFNFDGGLPPWTSALSQGTALQAFADAYKATKNSLYLAVGSKALALFTAAPPSGVAVETPLGARYVEYSFDPAAGDEVLNAFLKSLIGLYEYAQVSKSPLAAQLFAAGNAEAQAELPQFDTGSWSLYQPGVRDSLAYHELVIKLLQQLCTMTRAPIYCSTASDFESYLKASPGG
jgi:hypothetical protein